MVAVSSMATLRSSTVPPAARTSCLRAPRPLTVEDPHTVPAGQVSASRPRRGVLMPAFAAAVVASSAPAPASARSRGTMVFFIVPPLLRNSPRPAARTTLRCRYQCDHDHMDAARMSAVRTANAHGNTLKDLADR